MENYWDYYVGNEFSSVIESIEALSLAHTTSSRSLRSILKLTGLALPETEDHVLGKKVNFFYYGIPVFYRSGMADPCMLLLKPKYQEFYLDISWLPTDTGALQLIQEGKVISKHDKFKGMSYHQFVDEFVLNKEKHGTEIVKLLKSHIHYFFKNNKRYIKGNVLDELREKVDFNDFSEMLLDIYEQTSSIKLSDELKRKGYFSLDRRMKAIEGHYENGVSFRLFDLEFAYVPHRFDKRRLTRFFNCDESVIEDYPAGGGTNQDFVENGLNKYRKWLRKRR